MAGREIAPRGETATGFISQAILLLKKARTLPEVLELKSRAAAAEAYARAHKSEEGLREAFTVNAWAGRRAGEMLGDMKARGELRIGRKAANAPSLGSLGIDDHQSARWQALAAIPRARFARYLHDSEEYTWRGILAIAERKYAPPRTLTVEAYTPGGRRIAEEPDEDPPPGPLARPETPACTCTCPWCHDRGEHKLPMLPARGIAALV